MRVTADTGKCVGSGQCVLLVLEVFDQREEDGLVALVDERPPPERREAVRQAALSCPAGAIEVADD
ncbi:ferredoxin [Rugosimonospora acidiphila]|uniref:Ferredoxin n=1 Tax=Rugosimonospora acidiphila TaxID=556531 RepID=A0ABP9RWJ6_9ACTN